MTTLPDIHKTLQFKAPIAKVWNAVATSEGLAAWYMPNDFEPVEGQAFTLRGPFGPSACKVTAIDPPNRLTFSWDEDWVVTFELRELDRATTEFTLIHSGWIAGKILSGSGESHDVVHDRMNNGWESAVLPRLAGYVEA
jgi:uncharacterized protein YndB with AHSA1/START domain